MKKISTGILLLIMVISICSCKKKPIELYVSLDNGQEINEGDQLHFTSIEMALNEAKKIKLSDNAAQITINILPGNYYLEQPLSITPELNGITIKGERASSVNIKGSIPLQLSWDKVDDHIYKASVSSHMNFDQLIVNGKPQILARYPNYNEEARFWQGYAEDALSKEKMASWANPIGAYFHVMRNGIWGGFHYQIAGINNDGIPELIGGHQNNRPSRPHPKYRMVENVLEELDSAGEWFLDKENQELYFWPDEAVEIESAIIEVSSLKKLIEVTGNVETPVENVSIQGIKFEHTQRTFMEPYEQLLRSDWTIYRGGAIFFEGTKNCEVLECEFTNLGGNVIFASQYNEGLKIARNHIYNCGASGISFVGDPSAVRSPSFQYKEFVALEKMDTVPGPKNELYPRACLVEDNLIYRIGRIEKQTAGVQISMSMDITVRHNSIYDVPRAGINIGDGTWGGHILEYNDVFNTVLETGDHGSFNSWGRDRFWHPNRGVMDSITMANPNMPLWDAIHTTIIRNNRFRCDHGWDIDLDDGSSNYHIYNNLCLNRGIKLREGFYRVVENNIMVNNGFHPHVWFENSDDNFRKNIVGKDHADIRLKGWGNEIDYNLFPNETALIKAQINKVDDHSTYGDPLFNDPAHFDFSVKEESPALKLGFVNFPMDQFGTQDEELKKIAKTPELPILNSNSTTGEIQSDEVKWLNTIIKSVVSIEEQSAFGLNAPEGVIIINANNKNRDSNLEKGDVIIMAEGKKIENVTALLKVHKEYGELGIINLVVVRNQSEVELKVEI